MGGHIALRHAHDYPDVVEKLILLSPMVDIVTVPLPKWFVRSLVRVMTRWGFQYQYVPGSRHYFRRNEKFQGNRLTSDPLRFMDDKKAIQVNPDLAVGGVTYGWLAASLASISILTRPDYVRQITQPIHMLLAGQDRIVSAKASKKFCGAIKNGTFTLIPSARHEILKEVDGIRSVFWKVFDRFMSE
jgi:lysophospholipase